MVKTVKELREHLIGRETEELAKLEKEIDTALENQFLPGRLELNEVYVNVPEDFRFGGRVHQRLVAMYETAGWAVKHGADQREGAFLKFKPVEREATGEFLHEGMYGCGGESR